MVVGFIKSNIIARKDTSEVKGDPASLRSALSDRFTSFSSQKVRLRSLTLSSLRMTHGGEICANISIVRANIYNIFFHEVFWCYLLFF